MFDKAVDAFLPTLKFVPDWFVTNEMFKNLDDVVFCNDDIVFVNTDMSLFLLIIWDLIL